MGSHSGAVSANLHDFYADYYSNDVARKRAIAAKQSVDHLSKLASSNQGTLLDVGAGDGAVLAEIERRNMASKMDAVEISTSGIERIRARNLQTLRSVQQFDGYKLPFPDRSFDTAIAVHVLEHVEHERLFLRELGRVASRVYIEVPLEHTAMFNRSVSIGKTIGHINHYRMERLLSLLDSCDLKPAKYATFAHSLSYEQHLSGAVVGSLKYAVRSAALATAPFFAKKLMVYMGAAVCISRKTK